MAYASQSLLCNVKRDVALWIISVLLISCAQQHESNMFTSHMQYNYNSTDSSGPGLADSIFDSPSASVR